MGQCHNPPRSAVVGCSHPLADLCHPVRRRPSLYGSTPALASGPCFRPARKCAWRVAVVLRRVNANRRRFSPRRLAPPPRGLQKAPAAAYPAQNLFPAFHFARRPGPYVTCASPSTARESPRSESRRAQGVWVQAATHNGPSCAARLAAFRIQVAAAMCWLAIGPDSHRIVPFGPRRRCRRRLSCSQRSQRSLGRCRPR